MGRNTATPAPAETPKPARPSRRTGVMFRTLPLEAPLFIGFAILASLVYMRVRADALNLTTGLLFLGIICTLAFLVSEGSMRILAQSANWKNPIRLLLATVSALLFVVEIFLRYGLGLHATYMERNGESGYQSAFGSMTPFWFQVFSPNVEIRQPRTEFNHVRTTNSLGLAEREVSSEPSANEYRILALGDSFTEGVGTVDDSTWVRALGRKLTSAFPDKSITAINAGISGSDVYYEYMLLKERLLDLQPDLVIVAINNSDVNDIMVRGGMERFQADGTTVYGNSPPSWEWIYGISFIFRSIVHDVLGYDWLFMTPDEAVAAQRQALAQITTAVDAFVRLAREEGFRLLVVTHPHEGEMRTHNYFRGFGEVVADLANDTSIASIDLLDYYTVNGIITEETAAEFWWRLDAHHNGRGYEVMGDAIADAIKRLQIISN